MSQTDRDYALKFALDLSVNLTGTQLHNLAGVIAAARRDARQAALEEAAKVAEAETEEHLECARLAREDEDDPRYDRCMARFKAADRIAQAIRDLASKGKE